MKLQEAISIVKNIKSGFKYEPPSKANYSKAIAALQLLLEKVKNEKKK